MKNTNQSQLDTRRTADRIPPSQTKVAIYGLGDQPSPAAVLDESFAGLGVAVPIHMASSTQFVGMQVVIDYNGVRSWGEVRHASALPSGCRLGIEWKAEALSRSLRQLMVSKTSWANHALARILPSGLSNMWKLFEANEWDRLMQASERLRKESFGCDLVPLTDVIDEFRTNVNEALLTNDSVAGKVELALNNLILGCMHAVNPTHGAE